jgi:hypothetical protein
MSGHAYQLLEPGPLAFRAFASCDLFLAAAFDAFTAILLRSLAVKELALAFPPRRPNATAAGFLVSLMRSI